jgi:hypothetical protein
MTDFENLTFLREKLISTRRSLVVSLQQVAPERLSGESGSRIQNATETVSRTIEEEARSASNHDPRRQSVRLS